MRNGVPSIDICHGPCASPRARCAESADGLRFATQLDVSRHHQSSLFLFFSFSFFFFYSVRVVIRLRLYSRKWNVVWPRAVIPGSTTVMWIDGLDGLDETNVTVRLADSTRTFDEKTLWLQNGKAISPVELAIPFSYDGQLTVRLGCDALSGTGTAAVGCQSEEFPVHPLEAIQSLSLRLERTVYHPDDVGEFMSCLFWLPTSGLMNRIDRLFPPARPIPNRSFYFGCYFTKCRSGWPVWINTDKLWPETIPNAVRLALLRPRTT